MAGIPEDNSGHQIRRKPVLPPRTYTGSETEASSTKTPSKREELNSLRNEESTSKDLRNQEEEDVEYEDEPPPYDEVAFQEAEEANDRALEDMDLNATVETAADSECGDSAAEESDLSLGPSQSHGSDMSNDPNKPSKWKTALESTRTFASNLISHPVQSTRHYSILRHSHGLIAYRGLGTHVAITLFADEPVRVATGRTIWLQQRGWSGKRGMRMKTALGAHNAWKDVTPAATVEATQVREADETAWQRHIATFLRKAGAERRFVNRQPVETYVVRIPVTASDGYFRLVVCAPGRLGRRMVLCASPVFRIASLSASSAAFRGASLRTLPLEIGIKALTIFAASAATQGAAPLAVVIRNRFGAKVPGMVTRSATKAYGIVGDRVGTSSDMKFDGPSEGKSVHKHAMERQSSADEEVMVTIGNDDGPEPPYPVQFSGKVVRGAGKSNVETGLPTANLSGVSEWFKTRMDGIYFGWVSISQSKTITSEEWRPALIFARPPEGVRDASPKTVLRVFVIEDFAGVEFFDAKLDVLLLGFIRSWEETHPDRFQQETAVDILIARQSLERAKWKPEVILEKHKDTLSLSDWGRFTRRMGRWGVDRVPFEKLAIRMSQLEVRDGLMGRGGLCIDRRSVVVNAPPR